MQCKSVYSLTDRHTQCKLFSENDKYCVLHNNKDIKIDYKPENELKNYRISKKPVSYINVLSPNIINNITMPDSFFKNKSKVEKINSSYFAKAFETHECDLRIKLIILDKEHKADDTLAHLIGPVFYNILDSVDDIDPVTFDTFWKVVDNKKIDVYKNRYFLFSYFDNSNRLRCLTIFTLYDMYKNNQYIHPITCEELSQDNITRAEKLISIYTNELNLFSLMNIDSDNTPEVNLENKTTSLFSSFNKYNIYFEDNWFLKISSINNLKKILSESIILIKNNLSDNKEVIEVVNKKLKLDNSDVINTKLEILSLWEDVVNLIDLTKNQLPVWIIGYVLSMFEKDILLKYPTINNIV